MSETTKTDDKKKGRLKDENGNNLPAFYDPKLDVNEFQDKMDEIFLDIYMDPKYCYAKYVGMGVRKQMDLGCDTAYVGFDQGKNEIFLGYNPYFLAKYTKKQRKGVVGHEYLHVIFEHLTWRSTNNKKERMLLNIAQDLAINSIISNSDPTCLPELCFIPGEPLKSISPENSPDPAFSAFIEKLPKMLDSETYFEELMKFFKGKETPEEIVIVLGGGSGTLDNHDIWDDIPEHLKDAINEKIERALKEGIEEAKRTKTWGNVPAQIQQMLENMFAKVLDWESIVKNFLEMSRKSSMDSSYKRLKRKMPYDFPGIKRKRQPRFLFAIDQSGSMADEDVKDMVTLLLDCLGSKKAEVDAVNFDTEIDIDSLQTNIKKEKAFHWQRTRCGGTDFDCVRRYVNEPTNRKKYSGVLIGTDAYAPTMGQIFGAKVLWLITKQGDPNVDCARPGDLVVQMGERQLKRK
jgi:predicted metal-dependent peptidase